MSATKYLTTQGLTSLWSKIVKNLGILKDYLVDKITEETTARQAADAELRGLVDNKVSDVQVNGVSTVTSGKANIDLTSYVKSTALSDYATKTSLNNYAKLTNGKLPLDVIPDGISSSVDLTDYLKTADADTKYLSINGGTVKGDTKVEGMINTQWLKTWYIYRNAYNKYLCVADNEVSSDKVFSIDGGIADLSVYVKTSDLSNYITSDSLTNTLTNYASSSDLSKYLPLTGGTIAGALYMENYNQYPYVRIIHSKETVYRTYYYSALEYDGLFVRIPLDDSKKSYIESVYKANDAPSIDKINSYNAKIEKVTYNSSGTYSNTCGTYIGSDNIIVGLQNKNANTFYRNSKLTYDGIYFYKANETNTDSLDSLLTFSYSELSINTKLYIKSSFVKYGYSDMYKMTLGNVYLSDLKTNEVLAGRGTKIDISQYAKKSDLSGYVTSADLGDYIKAENNVDIRLNDNANINNETLTLREYVLNDDNPNPTGKNVVINGNSLSIINAEDSSTLTKITENGIYNQFFKLSTDSFTGDIDFMYQSSNLFVGKVIAANVPSDYLICGQGETISKLDLLSDYATTSSLNNYVAKNNIKTINGNSLVGTGNISIDLSIYTIVESLPTTNINKNKIYLVANSGSGDTANKYIEYIYTGDTAKDYNAANWEKLGEYKANVDLTPYLKSTDAANTYLSKTDASSTYQAKGSYAAASHTHNYLSSLVVGSTTYSVSGNKVTIPAYPTTLPASDVKAWAKADSKPSYSWSEIESKPTTFAPASHNHSADNITSGTLSVARGGTGKTTLNAAANDLINSLVQSGNGTPVDADYYVSQYINGGTTNITYTRRPMSSLYNYVKGKLDSVYQPKGNYLTSHQDITGKANKATTLAGYGITDAKIANGVITLGSNTITPLTAHQSLADYAKTVTTTGTGNAVTAITKSGNTITVTKGSNFLTSHQSLANYYTKTEVDNKIKSIDLSSYLTKSTADNYYFSKLGGTIGSASGNHVIVNNTIVTVADAYSVKCQMYPNNTNRSGRIQVIGGTTGYCAIRLSGDETESAEKWGGQLSIYNSSGQNTFTFNSAGIKAGDGCNYKNHLLATDGTFINKNKVVQLDSNNKIPSSYIGRTLSTKYSTSDCDVYEYVNPTYGLYIIDNDDKVLSLNVVDAVTNYDNLFGLLVIGITAKLILPFRLDGETYGGGSTNTINNIYDTYKTLNKKNIILRFPQSVQSSVAESMNRTFNGRTAKYLSRTEVDEIGRIMIGYTYNTITFSTTVSDYNFVSYIKRYMTLIKQKIMTDDMFIGYLMYFSNYNDNNNYYSYITFSNYNNNEARFRTRKDNSSYTEMKFCTVFDY